MQYTSYGIIVSRPISIVIETLLGVVALMAIILLYTVICSDSNLVSNPDSIASVFGKIKNQERLLSHLGAKDNLSEESLMHLSATTGTIWRGGTRTVLPYSFSQAKRNGPSSWKHS